MSLLNCSRMELEAVSRQASGSHYVGDHISLCKVMGRFPLYVETSDASVAPWLLMDGYWESWVTVELDLLLRPGMRVVDAGANMGYYSVLMSSCVGPHGRFLAVEANPRLAGLVRRSVALSGSGAWSEVISGALSDKSGANATLAIGPGDLGGASVVRDPRNGDAAVSVRTVTIDRLTEDWDSVDLVRMDIEGAEHMAWRGMQNTIKRNPQIVIATEFNPSRFDSPDGFLDEIQDAGFSLLAFEPDGLERVTARRVLDHDKDWMLLLSR